MDININSIVKKIFPAEPAPTSELAQKKAAIDARRSLLASRLEKRRQLAATTAQARDAQAATKKRADGFGSRAWAGTDALKAAAMRAFAEDDDASDKLAQAIAAEAAFGAECGDMAAEEKAIADAERLLLKEEIDGEYTALAADQLADLPRVAARDAKLHEIHRRRLQLFPGDGDGLVPLTFPPGVFRDSARPDGSQGSAYGHVMFKAGLAYRDLVPESVADSITAEIEAWREKPEHGLALIPRAQAWLQIGDWHRNPTDEREEKNVFRGPIGLQTHGLL